MTTFEERLSRALGAETVTLDPASLQNYALGGIGPCACATPTSVEQVSAAVALAAEAGVPCIPWGGGTRQSYGRPPRLARAPLILRTTALNRVRNDWGLSKSVFTQYKDGRFAPLIVVTTSESILKQMDAVTGLYVALASGKTLAVGRK